MNLSIVLPAHNEEKRIEKTLRSIYSALKKRQIEVIVVSNGSTDKTVATVKKFQKKYKNLICLEYKKKLGKGGALAKGFTKAKGDVIGFLDADDAFDMKGVLKMISMLNKYDCVIASKWIGRSFSEVDEPPLRKVLSRGWNVLAKLFFFIDVKETQAGAKFFTRKAYESISHNFVTTGFEFDVELLYRLKKNGNSIKEVWIPNKFVEGSTFSIKHIVGMFFNFFKLRAVSLFEDKNHKTKVISYYDDFSKEYASTFSKGFLRKLRMKERKTVWSLLSPKKNDVIFDAGCGTGFDAVPLLKKGAQVYGIDVSPGMVEGAKKRGVKAKVGDLENFSINKRFDKIICAGAFEFLKNHSTTLDLFYSHLKPNGFAVILYSRKSFMGYVFKMYYLILKRMNIRIFSDSEIKSLVGRSNFRIQTLKKPHFFAGVIKLVK